MSLIVALFTALAWASGSVVWLGEPTDASLTPGMRRIPVDEVAPDPRWSQEDESALQRLAAELEAVRPKVHEFDGELEIMGRLDPAIREVDAIRTAEHRRLLYRALALQGFAVQRYFQHGLGSDPSAAPYRVRVGGTTEVKAWVDAVALDPDHAPSPEDISEAPERAAFDEARARVLVAPKATIRVTNAPGDAVVSVNGQELAMSAWHGGAVRVVPGLHRITVTIDGVIRSRHDVRLDLSDEYLLVMQPTPETLDELMTAMSGAPQVMELPINLAGAFARLDPPVVVAVPTTPEPVLYRIEGTRAVLVEFERRPAATADDDPGPRASVVVWAGGMMLRDPNYQDLNLAAPRAYSTTNALGAALGGAFHLRVGPAWVGPGVDLFIPTGEWHQLPVGESSMRVRAHPHVFVGTDLASGSVGLLLPWHLALGGRLRLPVNGFAAIDAGAVLGFGLPRPREGAPTFHPRFVYAATIGLSTRLDLR